MLSENFIKVILRLFALGLFLIITSSVSFTQLVTPASSDNLNRPLHQLTALKGLPPDRVTGIVQDSVGFIWISTEGGLARYDGKTVKQFTHKNGNGNTIASNAISNTYLDSRNRLWLFYFSGSFDLFNPSTEKVRHLSEETGFMDKAGQLKGLLDLNKLRARSVFEDSKQCVWFVTEAYVARIDPQGKGCAKLFKNLCGLDDKIIRSINETGGGNLLIVTTKEIVEADADNHIIKRTPLPKEGRDAIEPRPQYNITVRKSDTLYTASSKGVNVYNIQSGRIFFRGGLPASAYSIRKIASPQKDRFLFYDTRQFHLYGYIAGEGAIKDLGKYVYVEKHEDFTIDIRDGLCCLYDRSGVLWHGGVGDVIFYESLKKQAYTINEATGDFPLPLRQFWQLSNEVASKLTTSYGEYPWILSPKGAAYIVDSTHRRRLVVPAPSVADKNRLTNKWEILYSGSSITLESEKQFDEKNRLWVADYLRKELFTIDTNGKTATCPQKILPGYSVMGVASSKDNFCWITRGLTGLCLYSLDKGFIKIINSKIGKFPLPTDEVMQIIRDDFDKNTLWISTGSSGLIKFNEQNETWRLYTQKDGLADNTLFNMIKDKHGFLWYRVKQGIYRFDTRKNIHKRIYTTRQSSTGNIQFGSVGYVGNNKLYFGAANYYLLFDADKIEESSNVPVAITDLKINNKPVEADDSLAIPAPINTLSLLQLAYDKNFIGFEFAAMDYTSPEKTQYRYRMEGIDKDWILNGTDNTAQYTSLPWGDYVFKVNATNTDGNWSIEVKSIRVIIFPPWWRTWWMYSIYATITIAAGYFFFKTRLHRLQLNQQIILKQKEAEQAHAMEEVKSHFFANITHELRTPLTLIMSPVQKQLQENGATYSPALLKGVYQNSKQLLRLINQLLDMSKLEAGKLNVILSRGDIALFIDGLLNAFRPEAAARNINLVWHYDDTNNEYLFDSDKLEKIIHNLVSNAFKFTPDKGSVRVALSLPEDINGKQAAQITVTDTGIGIPAEHLPHIFNRFYQANTSSTRKYEGTGIGLSLVKELTTLMGGGIKAESIVGKGSVFTLTLPLQAADYNAGIPAVEYAVIKEIPTDEPEKISASQLTEEAKPVILVTEDNIQLRSFIKESLSQHYKVITAANGEEGLNAAVKKLPDLIISDVMMPVIDGYEFCHKAKEHALTSHIGFILLTAKTADESRMGGLRSGADHYLSKPFIVEELLLVILNLLKRQQKLREFYSKQLKPDEKLPVVNEIEDSFLRTVYTTIEKNLDNPALDVEFLSSELAVNRRTLNRKLSAIANTSASEIIRTYRLKKSAELLLRGHNVTEAAYSTGFSTPSWFTQCFKEMYGVTPGKYIEDNSLSQN